MSRWISCCLSDIHTNLPCFPLKITKKAYLSYSIIKIYAKMPVGWHMADYSTKKVSEVQTYENCNM